MASITFDTLKLAQKLRDKAKFTPEQAEQTAAVLSKTFSDWQEQQQLATKSDLKTEIREVKSEIRELEARMDTKMEAIKADLIKWVVGMSFAQVGMLPALLKLH